MTKNTLKINDIVICGLFVALIAIGAFIKVPVPFVPFTLQTLFTTLAGLFLGGKKGFLCVFVYMILGLIGLPIGLKPSEGFTISSILGPFASRSQGAPPITGEAVPLGQYGCTKIPSEPSGPGARDRWKSCRNPTRDNVATEKRHCRIGLITRRS